MGIIGLLFNPTDQFQAQSSVELLLCGLMGEKAVCERLIRMTYIGTWNISSLDHVSKYGKQGGSIPFSHNNTDFHYEATSQMNN